MQNRRGAVIPIVAVCIVMLVGMAAIAIDIGMLYDSRAEAQRAADGAVLAGASALLQYRDMSEADKQDSATVRALEIAGMNHVLGTPVEASEVSIQFLQNNSRIAATVTRANMAPLFATIFGVNSLQVAATAHAMYYQGGSASCLKPFGVPDNDPFTLNSVGQSVLIWEKDQHNMYPLIKHLITGNNVRDAIESQVCNTSVITVGDVMELQSATAGMTGQVVQGLGTLMDLDPAISYDPNSPDTHPYEGFNRPDWRNSSRVLNLVTYNPATATETTFVVTGFISAFLAEPLVRDQGNRLQYAIILPHRPEAGSGPCTPPNCSALSWAFRLVQ
jgi:Flp pilus assembly protein TadG